VRAHLTDIRKTKHRGDVYERGLFCAGLRLWEVGIVEIGKGNPNAAHRTERRLRLPAEAVCSSAVAGGITRRSNWRCRGRESLLLSCGQGGWVQTRPEVAMLGTAFLSVPARSRKLDCWSVLSFPQPGAASILVPLRLANSGDIHAVRKLQAFRKAYNDALAVEMESYGFLDAARGVQGWSVAVRGISDLLEGSEADNSGSQERASAMPPPLPWGAGKTYSADNNIRTETWSSCGGSARTKSRRSDSHHSGGSVAVQIVQEPVSIQHALDLSELAPAARALIRLISAVRHDSPMITQQHVPRGCGSLQLAGKTQTCGRTHRSPNWGCCVLFQDWATAEGTLMASVTDQ